MSHLRIALAAALAVTMGPALADGPDIEKVNGSITAEAGQQYGSLSTVNGSIRLQAGAVVEDVETVNGSIRVAENATAESFETVNGSIKIAPQVQVGGDVETVNGSVFVDRGGRIGGDVETVNGAIGLVDTDLAGGIATVNGDITVGIGSHVHGGLTVEKQNNTWLPISIGKRQPPRIVIGPDARVDGTLRFEREVKLYVHGSAVIGPVEGAIAVRYDGDRAPRD